MEKSNFIQRQNNFAKVLHKYPYPFSKIDRKLLDQSENKKRYHLKKVIIRRMN